MGIGTQYIFTSSRARESDTADYSPNWLTFISSSTEGPDMLPYVSLFAVVGPQLTLRIVYDDIVILNSLLLIDVTVLLMGQL